MEARDEQYADIFKSRIITTDKFFIVNVQIILNVSLNGLRFSS
jgi:hypothetical protein